jgi:hypothetical protein
MQRQVPQRHRTRNSKAQRRAHCTQSTNLLGSNGGNRKRMALTGACTRTRRTRRRRCTRCRTRGARRSSGSLQNTNHTTGQAVAARGRGRSAAIEANRNDGTQQRCTRHAARSHRTVTENRNRASHQQTIRNAPWRASWISPPNWRLPFMTYPITHREHDQSHTSRTRRENATRAAGQLAEDNRGAASGLSP